MKFIVYDIEATCWEGRPPGMVQETIEIGAYSVDSFGQVGGAFSRLIKPLLHPQLSQFCRRLTQIEQPDINRARDFPRVIQAFQDWIDLDDEPYVLAAWGNFDERQLRRDCRLHDLDDSWLDPSINLRAQYRTGTAAPAPEAWACFRRSPRRAGMVGRSSTGRLTMRGKHGERLPQAA